MKRDWEMGWMREKSNSSDIWFKEDGNRLPWRLSLYVWDDFSSDLFSSTCLSLSLSSSNKFVNLLSGYLATMYKLHSVIRVEWKSNLRYMNVSTSTDQHTKHETFIPFTFRDGVNRKMLFSYILDSWCAHRNWWEGGKFLEGTKFFLLILRKNSVWTFYLKQ